MRARPLPLCGESTPGSYIDAEIVQDNTFDAGNSLNNVPRVSGSFWSTYEFQQGVLKGFGFGGGLFATGQREGDLGNSFEVDSYVRADAVAYFRHSERIEASLNIKNIFDEKYIESVSSRTEIYPGTPLTVLGTLSIRF